MVKVKDRVRFRVRFAYAYFDPIMSHGFLKSDNDQRIISKFCTRGNNLLVHIWIKILEVIFEATPELNINWGAHRKFM